MSQRTLPCTPPPQNCRGWVNFFRNYEIDRYLVFPKKCPQRKACASKIMLKKMSSKESLCFSELFRLKDQKACFFTIFTQNEF